MKVMLAITVALCLTLGASAGDEKGAKAIFVDSTSGAVINSTPARNVAGGNSKPTVRKPTASTRAAAPTPVPEVSGVKYYVELVSSNGETSRVTTERVFSSGERILLHVVSSVDGDIWVYQRAPDGRTVTLFPDKRIRDGNAHIVKGVDTILPSPTSWFRFDNQSGTEELWLVLTPRTAAAAPQDSQVAILTASMSYDELTSAAGSKALVMEVDSTGPEQATYAVRRTTNGQPPERIVVPVRLKHR